MVDETGTRHVVIGFLSAPTARCLPLMRRARRRDPGLARPRFFESVNVHVGAEHAGGLPLFGMQTIDPKGWQFAIKHVSRPYWVAAPLFCCSPPSWPAWRIARA